MTEISKNEFKCENLNMPEPNDHEDFNLAALKSSLQKIQLRQAQAEEIHKKDVYFYEDYITKSVTQMLQLERDISLVFKNHFTILQDNLLKFKEYLTNETVELKKEENNILSVKSKIDKKKQELLKKMDDTIDHTIVETQV